MMGMIFAGIVTAIAGFMVGVAIALIIAGLAMIWPITLIVFISLLIWG